MAWTRKRIAGSASVAAVVLGLVGCVADVGPATTASVRASVVAFEEDLDHLLQYNRVPETVSREIGPGDSGMDDGSVAGKILQNDIAGDTVTVEILMRATGFGGGGIFTDKADKYLCLTYVIEPHDGTYTRSESECPGEPNQGAELITIEELDLDPPGEGSDGDEG
jgi:hypothetical protein